MYHVGLVIFGFGDDVSFAQFYFDEFFVVEAEVDRYVGPVFVLAEGLAFCVAVAFLWTEELHLFLWFSIVWSIFGWWSEQVPDYVHDFWQQKYYFWFNKKLYTHFIHFIILIHILSKSSFIPLIFYIMAFHSYPLDLRFVKI